MADASSGAKNLALGKWPAAPRHVRDFLDLAELSVAAGFLAGFLLAAAPLVAICVAGAFAAGALLGVFVFDPGGNNIEAVCHRPG